MVLDTSNHDLIALGQKKSAYSEIREGRSGECYQMSEKYIPRKAETRNKEKKAATVKCGVPVLC